MLLGPYSRPKDIKVWLTLISLDLSLPCRGNVSTDSVMSTFDAIYNADGNIDSISFLFLALVKISA